MRSLQNNLKIKLDDTEQLLICNNDLQDVKRVRRNIEYLLLRRLEQY